MIQHGVKTAGASSFFRWSAWGFSYAVADCDCRLAPRLTAIQLTVAQKVRSLHGRHPSSVPLPLNPKPYSPTKPNRWGKPVIVYGSADLPRDHPVIQYLAKEGRAASVQFYREGLEAWEARYPYLVTQSVKQGCFKQ